jgi:hypothetical protein
LSEFSPIAPVLDSEDMRITPQHEKNRSLCRGFGVGGVVLLADRLH